MSQRETTYLPVLVLHPTTDWTLVFTLVLITVSWLPNLHNMIRVAHCFLVIYINANGGDLLVFQVTSIRPVGVNYELPKTFRNNRLKKTYSRIRSLDLRLKKTYRGSACISQHDGARLVRYTRELFGAGERTSWRLLEVTFGQLILKAFSTCHPKEIITIVI